MRPALVVEDDRAIQGLIVELLREAGLQAVLTAGTAEEARVLASEQPLELVVLDYVLPEASGIEVAEQLRAMPGFDAPVLVMTALPAHEASKVCEHVGACGCVSKPFDITAFLEAVKSCLKDRRIMNAPH